MDLLYNSVSCFLCSLSLYLLSGSLTKETQGQGSGLGVVITVILHAARRFGMQGAPYKIWLNGEKKPQIRHSQNMRHNPGEVVADEPNLMDTCIKHKAKCHNTGKWKLSVNLQFTKQTNKKSLNGSEQCMQLHFLKMNSTADSNQPTKFQVCCGIW